MKWHSINITIAAALLITLPYGVNSAHCDAESWNRALILQQELDQKYNFHATRFNQFLQIHQAQPFLYQEFTTDELKGLWQSDNHTFHQHMQTQAQASGVVISRINEEKRLLDPLVNQASAMEKRWLSISKHCKKSGSQSNVISGWQYSQANQAMRKDIESLISKLTILEGRYRNEVEALENAKPKLQN
ncbi:hypothetical protein OPW39_17790 [Vibrio europaeus]|uniref:hypothetical protein n=1 Tax=Vibrio europaeus TaxID=300876 RepID=UPI00233F6662|nr:hypothetical protein [Vibrio europaeus]MDC5870655.1 hypothetical protein [Vibrio europaeus]